MDKGKLFNEISRTRVRSRLLSKSLTVWKLVRDKICGPLCGEKTHKTVTKRQQNPPSFHSNSPLNNFGILLLKWNIHSKASFDSIILPRSVLEVVHEPYLKHCFLGYNFALCHRQKHFADCLHSLLPEEPVWVLKETSIFLYQLIYSAS